MHKLLQRQIKQAREAGATDEIDLDALLALVDAAYNEADRERSYTTRAHQVMREEQADLLKRQLETREAMALIAAEKAEAERARIAAEAELLKGERLSLLGQLTASVAHEMRNPLSTIRNTLQAIRHVAEGKGVEIGRQMARIERTIDRCDGIIDDLLDYAGSRELHPAPVSLDTWLGEVLADQTIPASIAVERRFGASGGVVSIDSDRVRCAIANLIENAAEAIVDSPDLAERRITISTHAAASQSGAKAEIVIADTGPGMSEDVLARIFEPLFSTRAFGTGLGLPTVKRIIEQHGGDMVIGSVLGAGTRVQIRIPTASASRSAAA